MSPKGHAKIELNDGRGELRASEDIPVLASGTMVSRDLDASKKFYEKFLGFLCVRVSGERMLICDAKSAEALRAGDSEFLVIDVRQVDAIGNPQKMLHHWGLTVATTEEVDRIHAAAKEHQEEFGITKIMNITHLHGAYSFYMADRDTNWWEIECRLHGRTNNQVIAGGDYDKSK